MNGFWSNVCAGIVGAIVSATAMATVGALWPLGMHLIIPEDAVIPVSGSCPSGWQRYKAADGQYIIAPDGGLPLARSKSQESAPDAMAAGQTMVPTPEAKLTIPGAYMVLSLCQRR